MSPAPRRAPSSALDGPRRGPMAFARKSPASPSERRLRRRLARLRVVEGARRRLLGSAGCRWRCLLPARPAKQEHRLRCRARARLRVEGIRPFWLPALRGASAAPFQRDGAPAGRRPPSTSRLASHPFSDRTSASGHCAALVALRRILGTARTRPHELYAWVGSVRLCCCRGIALCANVAAPHPAFVEPIYRQLVLHQAPNACCGRRAPSLRPRISVIGRFGSCEYLLAGTSLDVFQEPAFVRR